MEQKKVLNTRDSNIELLRIFAILGVIVLHYNNGSMGGGLEFVNKGSVNYYVMLFLQAVFICGVNLFVLISGYFMCTSPRRSIVKPIQLLIQVAAFRVLVSVPGWITSGMFSVKSLVNCLIPVNYFAILYVALYFVSPYINIILFSLDKRSLKYMLIISILLFSFWPTMVDVLQILTVSEYNGLSTIGIDGSQLGYTIVNFVLLYIIGGYIRVRDIKAEEKKDIKASRLCVGFIFFVALIMVWSIWNTSTAWAYCNPLVIIESVTLFLLFRKWNFKSKLINSMSKATFTVFLLHTIFLRWLHIPDFVNRNVFIMLLHVFVSCIAIYIICYFVWLIYDMLTKPIYKILFKNVKTYSVDVEK